MLSLNGSGDQQQIYTYDMNNKLELQAAYSVQPTMWLLLQYIQVMTTGSGRQILTDWALFIEFR